MSLGSNCCVAKSVKQLNIREPGPFDWTNNVPLSQQLYLKKCYNIDEYIKLNKFYYIHENLDNIDEYNKIKNRINSFLKWKGDFIYLLEQYSCTNFSFISTLIYLRNYKNQRIYVIISNDIKLTRVEEHFLKLSNIFVLYDSDKIFDSGKLNENLELMCNFIKRNILENKI